MGISVVGISGIIDSGTNACSPMCGVNTVKDMTEILADMNAESGLYFRTGDQALVAEDPGPPL